MNATFTGRDRAAAFGVWGAVMAGAAALGPLVGGWLTQMLGWRSVFWINVPLGALIALGVVLIVPETRSGGRGVDPVGTVLSAVGLGLLVFGLIEGNRVGWWHPTAGLSLLDVTWPRDLPLSIAPVALGSGSLLIALVVAWERHRAGRGRATALEPALFRLPTFAWGNLTALLVAVGEFALLFVLPLFLVTSLGLSTIGSGLVLAAMAGGAFLAGSRARHLSARFGAPSVVVLGLGLELVGVVTTALVAGSAGPVWGIAAALLPYGVGLGLASAQLTSTTLRDVPRAVSGVGSATQSTVRQLGAALGSTVGGTALTASLGTHQAGALTDPARFAAATSGAVWVAAGVLLLGFLASIALARASGDDSSPRPVAAPDRRTVAPIRHR